MLTVHPCLGLGLNVSLAAVFCGALACGADPARNIASQDEGSDPTEESPEIVLPDPVLFVHGVNSEGADFDAMMARLIADGWPADRLMARLFDDPSLGCNVDNAETLVAWAEELLAATGAARVDIVAHSMGSLSSRRYVRDLGGHNRVNTYVTLGGMHHGLIPPCFSPEGLQCTWDELCATRDFIEALNTNPVILGPARWVSIYGTADSTVPNWSSELEGAELVSFDGVEHAGAAGLLEVEEVYLEVRRVLAY